MRTLTPTYEYQTPSLDSWLMSGRQLCCVGGGRGDWTTVLTDTFSAECTECTCGALVVQSALVVH